MISWNYLREYTMNQSKIGQVDKEIYIFCRNRVVIELYFAI